MLKLCKFIIGVKPSRRMFRMTALSGALADSIIDSIGTKDLPDDYFENVLRTPDGSNVRLTHSDGLNSLSVDTENLILTKDYYDGGGYFKYEDVVREFRQIWIAADSVLKMKDIRRIGMVGEYRFIPGGSAPSVALLKHLTQFELKGHTARFLMQFESRMMATGEHGLPDVNKSDFWNTIETYYDSALDAEHSDPEHITAMLDVQRYYMPLCKGDVLGELQSLKRRFDDSSKAMKQRLQVLGLDDGEAEK